MTAGALKYPQRYGRQAGSRGILDFLRLPECFALRIPPPHL